MDARPLISVIIPVYNTPLPYLDRCVHSVFVQTYAEKEIILIDDGSKPALKHKLQELKEQDKRIQLIQQTNQGVVAARKKGIEAAKGTYLFFLDADDYLHPFFFTQLVKKALQTKSEVVVSNHIRVFANREKKRGKNTFDTLSPETYIKLLIETRDFSIWGKLFHRSLFEKTLDMPAELKIGEDLYLLLQLLFYAKSIAATDLAGYYYLIQGTSVMHTYTAEKALNNLLAAQYISRLLEAHAFDPEYIAAVNLIFLKGSFLSGKLKKPRHPLIQRIYKNYFSIARSNRFIGKAATFYLILFKKHLNLSPLTGYLLNKLSQRKV